MSCEVKTLSLGLFICTLVVSFIYIFSWNHDRFSVEGVKLRMIGTFFASMGSVSLLQLNGFLEVDDLIPSFTLYTFPQFKTTIIWPITIAVAFFFGPLCDRWIDGSLFRNQTPMKLHTKLRNYLFGPIVEEFTYRFLMTNLLINCFDSKLTTMFGAMFFSISHIHHHYAALLRTRRCDWGAFFAHMTSTFVFGLFSAVIYIKIRSIISLTLIHSFCNYMGIPRADRIIKKENLCLATTLGFITSMCLLYYFIQYC